MAAFDVHEEAFEPAYLAHLTRQVLASRHLGANHLNRDFVGARGFSVAFRRDGRAEFEREFPWLVTYLERVLSSDCNAFYWNPLVLQRGSRVDPHIDRSLRAYCKTIEPPLKVSVVYLEVPANLRGGNLVLERNRRRLAQIRPRENLWIEFGGDLTHSIERVESDGRRSSLVLEQYCASEAELEQLPRFTIEREKRAYD